jgi:predicted ATPase
MLEEALGAGRVSTAGSLVLVAGEASVGKTVLMRALRDSRGRPVRVLSGACEPLLTSRPLGPLFDVAQAVGGELEELVFGDARPHVVVAALMGELGRRSPTVLVIEDLHWADEATLDALRLLGRRVGSVPASGAVAGNLIRLSGKPFTTTRRTHV